VAGVRRGQERQEELRIESQQQELFHEHSS
jgi:hypothetical protein